MLIKIYQKYLVSELFSKIFQVTSIFFALGFIMGILEELSFFSGTDVNYYYPFLLVLLNIPSLIYELFPFIILISVQLLLMKIIDNGELVTFKNNGLSNLKIVKIISLTSFLIGLVVIILLYNFSAVLKFQYLDIKKNYTNDDKYLATITENGLWIKDEIDNQINFINAKKIGLNSLVDVEIVQLDKDFNYLNSIKTNEIFIKDNLWVIYEATIINMENKTNITKNYKFNSNFNYEKINNLYSNLSSITVWGLFDLKKDYDLVNYSTIEIEYHLQKILSYPIFLTIMSIISLVIMMNIKFQKNKIIYIVFGILLSVSIYYINYFFGIIGKNERIPLTIALWIPLIILSIFSVIGLIKINEK
jgi:lipopolysaccharide export system permease protein